MKSLNYKFIPARRFQRGVASPYLMIVLHGRGDSSSSFSEFDLELKIPGMNYVVVDAPRSYAGGFTWYGFPPRQAKGIQRSALYLENLIIELNEMGWDSENIFILGHSQGALMTSELAMTRDELFGGFISISGYVYFFENWLKRVRPHAFHQHWLITHGSEDLALPIQETEDCVARLLKANLPVEWKIFKKDHFLESEVEFAFVREWVLNRMDPLKVMSSMSYPFEMLKRLLKG